MQNIQKIIEEKELVGLEVGQAEDIAKRLSGEVMELTPEEIKLILAHRENIKKRLAHKAWTKGILEVALNFSSWLDAHDIHPTYSTFCNDFSGYSESDGRGEFLYTTALKIIDIARKAAGDKVNQ